MEILRGIGANKKAGNKPAFCIRDCDQAFLCPNGASVFTGNVLAGSQCEGLSQVFAVRPGKLHLGEGYRQNHEDQDCYEQHSRVQQFRFHASPHTRMSALSATNLTLR